ncbi:HNH endonuclease [Arenibaculum pallidiluteum]|uniref:HNH endonuclease n=1 Tax=Arenibaculum pallidiluteum TaxID=2812559 RepID=UPI001A9600BE|nr:HNH endonuclease [Arenibaculum pallidiluteum]
MSRKHARLQSLGSPIATLSTVTAKPSPKRAEAFYLSPDWRTLVARLITQRGRRCEECGKAGCRIFGDHVHELKDGGAPLDSSNVKLLCGACHSAKTARVRAERMATHHRR